MVPDIAKSGHSFKGAMAYYLHDKRQEGDTRQPTTAERVAWTQTRNLSTDDPHIAMRIMVATAQSADELKKAAGVKNTGRKSNAHVYAYSLAWHPDEAATLDKAEMLRAVDQSLQALGAENHQAILVCHQDQKHPHVHVILNRVDPATGKMLSTSNDRLKLSDWANQYERERGQIVTPKREEKRELREQYADAAARKRHAAERRQEAEQRPASAKSAGAMLKEFQEAQKAAHKAQWADLSERNKAARNAIFGGYGEKIKKAAALHKAECKPIWAQYFRTERTERHAFEQREKTLSGVIVNAMAATTQQKISGQLGNRGVLSATFGNALSSQARAAAYAERESMNRLAMSRRLKTILDGEIGGLKEKRAAALDAQRKAFDAARANLIETQNNERAKIREAWRQHYHAKAQERGPDRSADRADRHREKMEVKNRIRRPDNQARDKWQDRRASRVELASRNNQAQEKPAPQQEHEPMKRTFDSARIAPQEPRRAPTSPDYVARPAPAPSPSGDVPKPPQRTLQDVPAQKPAPANQPKSLPDAKQKFDGATGKRGEVVPPKDWSKPADSPAARPVVEAWDAKAPAAPREIKPFVPRDKTKTKSR